MAELVSLETVKAHLNLTGTADDAELAGYLEAATDVVGRHLGTVVVPDTAVSEVQHLSGHCPRLVLNRFPVASLTAVADVDGTTVWDLADLLLDSDTGVVTVLSGPRLRGRVRVDYVAGPAVVNAAHALAAQIIVAHLWETQRAAAAGPQGPFGEDEILTPTGMGYAIPHRALQLLGEPAPVVG